MADVLSPQAPALLGTFMADRWHAYPAERPDAGQRVLATDGTLMLVFRFEGACHGNPWEDVGYSGYDRECALETRRITHWRPLPALPLAGESHG